MKICKNCKQCHWDNSVDLYSCDVKEEYVKPDETCEDFEVKDDEV